MLSSHNLFLLMLNLSTLLRGLLRLLHGFVKVVLCISRPLPKKNQAEVQLNSAKAISFFTLSSNIEQYEILM